MSIRRTLRVSFVLVGVVPAVVLALLAFDRAGAALQREIELGLVAQADAVAGDVNRLLYERLQNAATWSRLEVMQDLQVGDVDKRLSDFLQRLQRGYGGLYRSLLASDGRGRVVAASHAELVGQPASVAAGPASTAAAGPVRLGDEAITLAWQATPPALALRVAVPSRFGAGTLGQLQLLFDVAQIDQLLDQAADDGRELALLDAQGRLLAASARLRAAWPRLQPVPAGWARLALGAHTLEGQPPWDGRTLIAGVGQAAAYANLQGQGLGLRLLVLLPRADALAPVRATGLIFAGLLAAVLLGTLAASSAVSQRLAQPILALAAFVGSRQRAEAGRAEAAEPPMPPPPPPMSGELGQLRDAFVQLLADIEQSQRKLAQASALAAVGEMSAIIAHEVRTPLGILRSSAQVLRREPVLSAEGRELLGFIESETERLAGLVSSMLDSARPRPPQLQPVPLDELLRHAVALLSAQAAKQDVSFTLELAGGDTTLEADPEQLTQVFLNLMLNALQILPRGGRIALRTVAAAERLTVHVGDDGPGIAPEARQRVFEAFFFQREGGLGLGLAVVQRIVAAHGGIIEAGTSELGGALFTISLPRSQTSP